MIKHTSLAIALAIFVSVFTAAVAMAATLTGTPGNDTINGTDAADQILGYAGNDTLSGRAEDDAINGGDGNDLVYGDKGSDTLEGKSGRDRQQGGEGNDSIFAGNDAETDFVNCGPNTDRAHILANDLIDGDVSGQSLLDGTGAVTSCETIFVNGIRVTG